MTMMLRFLLFPLMVLSLALTLGGCSTGPVRHLASDVCMVKVGQTSRQEVLELMGEPDSRRMVAPSTEQWLYYEEDRSTLQAAPVVGETFDPSGYHMVMITLAGDLVSTCRYSAYDEDEFDWQDDYSWQEIEKMIDRFATVRERMVQEQLLHRGITDSRTLQAMAEVPRHLFVDDAMQAGAYGDHPLPIGGDQTISQPYIVAAMTQALQLKGDEKVLEIGTGSGYQAAILSRLCAKVYTVERINTLLAGARRVFDRLHYYNILSRLDDGTLGWEEHAPYDAIIVTAGGPAVPDSLVAQLADPGRLMIPVGGRDVQELQLLTKKDGEIRTRCLERVRFVSLIGEEGWNG